MYTLCLGVAGFATSARVASTNCVPAYSVSFEVDSNSGSSVARKHAATQSASEPDAPDRNTVVKLDPPQLHRTITRQPGRVVA